MKRPVVLLLPALLLAAACTESPTAATKRPAVRYDSGNVVPTDGTTGPGSDNLTETTATGGGNSLGSGNLEDTSSADGGNSLGSGNATGGSTGGGNTLGSGN